MIKFNYKDWRMIYMNKKGFTLIELLATIIILALVMSIGAYSITAIIKNSKQKNYELLIGNIKDAAEELYDKVRMYTDMNGINNAPLNTIRDFSEKIYDIASKKHEQASRGYKKLSDEIDMDAAYGDPEMKYKIPEDQDAASSQYEALQPHFCERCHNGDWKRDAGLLHYVHRVS